jgi:glycosyltransferase involved in cell wall biosynthesis
MKVLFITKWFMNRHDPQLGVFIRKHASAAALYNDVFLLCVLGDSSQQSLFEFEEKEEYHVRTLLVYFRKFNSPLAPINSIINFFRYLLANRKGLKQIEKKFGKHEVTHAYIMLRPAGIAWWLKITRGIPFVISEQWSGYATGKFSEKNLIVRFIYRWLFSRADAVTAVSGFLRKKMEAAGMKNNYTITPNVVEPFGKKSAPLSANGKIKILTVADLVDGIKNISAVIKAVSKISETNSDVEYHIIGHGKDEAVLKNLARNMNVLDRIVFFHGVKTNEEVFSYLHDCDFLVVNSRYETFSLICIEAMSCGKPVIATRCGGPEEFMTEENGMLIPPDDQEQLERALQIMISDYKKYDPQLLKLYALKNFGADETGKKFAEIYRQILRM